MKNMVMKALGALVVSAAFPLAAHAGACVAFSDLSNPDATLTNSTSCGEGLRNSAAEETAADVIEATGILGWVDLDTDNDADESSSGVLRSTNIPEGISGAWAFDAVAGYDQYLLVIKDGSVPNPPGNGDTISWFWFIVDLSFGCDTTTQSSFTEQGYCGSWTMYGNGGEEKGISNLSLYARNGSTVIVEIPEPGILFLMGAGLLGLGMAHRRKSA